MASDALALQSLQFLFCPAGSGLGQNRQVALFDFQSHSQDCSNNSSAKEQSNMKGKLTHKANWLFSILVIAASCSFMLGSTLADDSEYTVTTLASFGGSSSGGNSVNNLGYVAGYSNQADDLSRHAVVWRNDANHTLVDLG